MENFRVEVISRTPNPQQTIYAAMRQDYIEGFAYDRLGMGTHIDCCVDAKTGLQYDEKEAGDEVVKQLLNGNRGHYGPLEHPQIVINCGWLPHSTMQQIRTHRVGVSFDVQSFRYTGSRIRNLGKTFKDHISCWANDVEDVLYDGNEGVWNLDLAERIESVFYLRPVGDYNDRKGKKYTYSEDIRRQDLIWCAEAAIRYCTRIEQGLSEEHARSIIPFDVRQHWVMSANVRSMMHLLDLRWKADAQLEAQQFCEKIWPHFKSWVPEVGAWYEKNRAQKARLAP